MKQGLSPGTWRVDVPGPGQSLLGVVTGKGEIGLGSSQEEHAATYYLISASTAFLKLTF